MVDIKKIPMNRKDKQEETPKAKAKKEESPKAEDKKEEKK